MKLAFAHPSRILLGLLLSLAAGVASAQTTPTTINYQGRLTDNTPQQNPFDGTANMAFEIWDAQTGGSRLWVEPASGTTPVAVSKGIFSLLLGSNGVPVPTSLFSGGSSRWLQLIVNGETLAPRQAISSTGYAAQAEKASSATSTVSFSGSLVGDVTGSQGATVVSSVGGQSAADVAAASALANAATSANTSSTLVRRDGTGGFSAGSGSFSEVRLRDSATNSVGVKAPASVGASYTLTTPTAAPTPPAVGQMLLQGDGTGQLSWVGAPGLQGAYAQMTLSASFGSTYILLLTVQNVWVTVPFNTVSLNPFGGPADPGTQRMFIKESGTYWVSAQLSVGMSHAARLYNIALFKNGAQLGDFTSFLYPGAASAVGVVTVSGLLQLNQGDSLQVAMRDTTGNTSTATLYGGGCRFTVHMISR